MPLGVAATAVLLGLSAAPATAQPARTVDLAVVPTSAFVLERIYGSVGNGKAGVPVAGGFDVDGDGLPDVAFSAMQAPPNRRGRTFLIFGDGALSGSLDTSVPSAAFLELDGAVDWETAGSEIWMGEITGGAAPRLGDLLIARQNYTLDPGGPDERVGAGALSVVVGSPALRTRAESPLPVDLDNAGASLTVLTFIGPHAFSRLGIWMRVGDVTGDGVDDLVMGADQENGAATHSGAVYVVRGGPHLATNAVIDLADFGATPLAGHIARVIPPASPTPGHYHFGATCQVADLDGDGHAEVLAAAALNRAGAQLNATGGTGGTAHAVGGAPRGSAYIVWGERFAGVWPPGWTTAVDAGSHSILTGGTGNFKFGEELLGGLDYDADGHADLFVGDIVADLPGSRPQSGSGHVFYDAAQLRGEVFDLDDSPLPTATSTFWGAAAGDIAGDTAGHGDWNGDGIADLAFSAPHATALGRVFAGAIYGFQGQAGGWPALVDLAAPPPPSQLVLTEIYGANGRVDPLTDEGDTLSYSAAAADLNGDGRTDFITNEMVGNGIAPGTLDVGNLILVSGALLAVGPAPVPAAPAWGGVALALGLVTVGWIWRRSR